MEILNKILLVFFVTLMLVGTANAGSSLTTTLTIPVDDTWYNADFVLTATRTQGAGSVITNATFYWVNASGSTVVGINVSANLTTYTYPFTITSVADAEDFTFTVNMSVNGTGVTDQITDQNTGVDIDDTDPVSVLAELPPFVYMWREMYADCSGSSDNFVTLTYLITVTKPDATTTTSTSSTHTFSDGDFDQFGEFTVNCVVTDQATNTNTCTSQTVIVKKKTHDAVITPDDEVKKKEEDSRKITVYAIIIVLFLAIAIFFIVVVSKEKKKKRKKKR